MEIICFFCGILFVLLSKIYVLAFLTLVVFIKPKLKWLGWFLLGILITLGHHYLIDNKGMPNTAVIRQAQLTGYVASIPKTQFHKTQLTFAAESLNGKPVKALLLLNCYKYCPTFNVGEYWQLQINLKRPRNYENPGSFDYQGWLAARHIEWIGNIRPQQAQLLKRPLAANVILQWRSKLAKRLEKLDVNETQLGIIQALTLGIGNHFPQHKWQLFRRTGTIHLMVISGAHIGLIAGMIYKLVRLLWGRSYRLCLWLPSQKIASLLSLMLAGVYAVLAGFGVPAQRALIVCFFMSMRFICNQRFTVWQAWRYSLFVVLILEPHSVVLPGFYLSFLAVALLLITNQLFLKNGLKKTVAMQLSCLLGLLPLTCFWFSYGAVNGFFANLFAIPLVGFIIIPLSLLAMILGTSFVNLGLLNILKMAMNGLLFGLKKVDEFNQFNLQTSFPDIIYPIALMLAMYILICIPFRRLYPLAGLIFLVGISPGHQRIKAGHASIDVLDVGQGLAVVVRTRNHNLIYDTGVKYHQGSDMGNLVLVPFLKKQGLRGIDKVVISHSDLDHSGGLSSLLAQYPSQTLIVNDPKEYKKAVSCHHFPSWIWDDVLFRFFPLDTKSLKGNNNHSCVLQVVSSQASLLLTGDIEKQAEQYLVRHYGRELSSEYLLVPHHASKTSSSLEFIQTILPTYAIASYGFENRYHFPHKPVLKRYEKKDIKFFNTVNCGSIHIELGSPNIQIPGCYASRRL